MTTPPHTFPAPQTVVDPVCGMTISPADAVGTADYQGETYHFCSVACLEQFRADPAKFVDPSPRQEGAASMDLEADYTCPMHPEIRQKAPGSCPICGMALEPVTVTLARSAERRARRHDAAVPMGTGAHRTNSRAHDRRVHPRAASSSASAHRCVELDRARARDARGAVGGMAVLRARMVVGGQPAPEHVHADRARCRRGLRIQRGGDACT